MDFPIFGVKFPLRTDQLFERYVAIVELTQQSKFFHGYRKETEIKNEGTFGQPWSGLLHLRSHPEWPALLPAGTTGKASLSRILLTDCLRFIVCVLISAVCGLVRTWYPFWLGLVGTVPVCCSFQDLFWSLRLRPPKKTVYSWNRRVSSKMSSHQKFHKWPASWSSHQGNSCSEYHWSLIRSRRYLPAWFDCS